MAKLSKGLRQLIAPAVERPEQVRVEIERCGDCVNVHPLTKRPFIANDGRVFQGECDKLPWGYGTQMLLWHNHLPQFRCKFYQEKEK